MKMAKATVNEERRAINVKVTQESFQVLLTASVEAQAAGIAGYRDGAPGSILADAVEAILNPAHTPTKGAALLQSYVARQAK